MRFLPFVRAAAAVFAMFVVVAPLSRMAAAHAVIVDSSPAPGAEISAGNTKVVLHFNSRIDHQRSRLTLVPADGAAHAVPFRSDSAPDVMEATLQDLAPGQYRLRWQVLAVDGHLTRGDIPFRVKAP